IVVLSTLQLTQEEIKESYMAGLLSEVDISGVRGHEKDSGTEELRYEDNSTEHREANHCSSPTNSLKSHRSLGLGERKVAAVIDKGLQDWQDSGEKKPRRLVIKGKEFGEIEEYITNE
ncbi:hypothetical protein MKW92_003965, partial [Papaver armeniacum]